MSYDRARVLSFVLVSLALGCDSGAAGSKPTPAPVDGERVAVDSRRPAKRPAPAPKAGENATARAPANTQHAPTPEAAAPAAAPPAEEEQKDWWCLCYQREVDAGPEDVTACRPEPKACFTLQSRAGEGTRSIVAKSVPEGRGCRSIGNGVHPGDLLNGHEAWLPSSRPGSFFHVGRCMLGDAPESTAELYSIGPLREGLPAKEVLALLGKPEEKDLIEEEGATGQFYQSWLYPAKGLNLGMLSDTARGPQRVGAIIVNAPSTYKTPHGVGVGTPYADAQRIYAPYVDAEEQLNEGQLIVGSIYGGMFFTRGERGEVSRVFIGTNAE